MTILADELQRLLGFLEEQGRRPPTRQLRIVEVPHGAPLDPLGRIRLRRNEVHEPSDYEPRFNELMKAGLPWLNVTCYGVQDDTLLVGIEVPTAPVTPSSRTSVNFSGPAKRVVDNEWKVDQVLVID